MDIQKYADISTGSQARSGDTISFISTRGERHTSPNGAPLFFVRMILLLPIALMIGCANTGYRYTSADVKAAAQYCLDRSEEDKRVRANTWFTRWILCTQAHIMPMEIWAYPSKEDDIRMMYKKLLVRARDVDTRRVRVETVYGEWDQMRKELGMARCALKIVDQDSRRCIFSSL